MLISLQNNSCICSLIFLFDDRTLLTGSADGYIKSWNLNEKSPRNEIKAHTDIVSTIIHFNNILVTGSWDKSIKVWELD